MAPITVNDEVESWGRIFRVSQTVTTPGYLADARAALKHCDQSILPIGAARSYGDVCFNRDGKLLRTTTLDRLIAADWSTPVWRRLPSPRAGSAPRRWRAPPRAWRRPASDNTYTACCMKNGSDEA